MYSFCCILRYLQDLHFRTLLHRPKLKSFANVRLALLSATFRSYRASLCEPVDLRDLAVSSPGSSADGACQTDDPVRPGPVRVAGRRRPRQPFHRRRQDFPGSRIFYNVFSACPRAQVLSCFFVGDIFYFGTRTGVFCPTPFRFFSVQK